MAALFTPASFQVCLAMSAKASTPSLVRKAVSATKTPKITTGFMTTGLPAAISSLRIRRNDAFAEGEAAIEAALAGLDDAIGLLGALVEGVALDRDHRPGFALCCVYFLLHFLLHRRDLVRLADDL